MGKLGTHMVDPCHTWANVPVYEICYFQQSNQILEINGKTWSFKGIQGISNAHKGLQLLLQETQGMPCEWLHKGNC